METNPCEWTTAFAHPCKHCCSVSGDKAAAVRTDMEGRVADFTRNGCKKEVPGYNLKRVFKAFQVWGGAFISSANDNKSFDVPTVQKCGLCIT